MRTLDQITEIKKTFSEPYSVDNFLSHDEILCLTQIYEMNSRFHVRKPTGPVTLDINKVINHPTIKLILTRIEKEIGPFEIAAGLFFHTSFPHIIHNDDTFELPSNVYKAIAIPLQITGGATDIPKLCFFDQYYFHGPAKFFNGDSNITECFNEHIYSYEHVDGVKSTTPVNKPSYFTHLKPQWLTGLSLHSALPWNTGSAIIFDSVQLHCSSDFRSLGITSKLGLSIFTKTA